MNIFLVDLESVSTRYTCEWKEGIPKLLLEYFSNKNKNTKIFKGLDFFFSYGLGSPKENDINIIVIEGKTNSSSKATEGAFLNFSGTNIYKNQQAEQIAKAFQFNLIKPGDKILITDAWNPCVIQFKYMSELLDIPIEIHAIWHAGSYDPNDFLGRKIKNKNWSFSFEKSLFYSIDKNYFATNFHIDLFLNSLGVIDKDVIHDKIVLSGQPHNILIKELGKYSNIKKENIILFPHRIAPEKQPDIFRDLSKCMPEYEWVICQERELSKNDYRELLGKSKMVFSANLQETLGISAMEAILVNTIPFLPDRLSYSEMYNKNFLYPSKWTSSWKNYLTYRTDIIYNIKTLLKLTETFSNSVEYLFKTQKNKLVENYLYPEKMLELLSRKESIDGNIKNNNKKN